VAGGEVGKTRAGSYSSRNIDMVLAHLSLNLFGGLERLGYSVKSAQTVQYNAVRPSWAK
jgi:hypothetical protein